MREMKTDMTKYSRWNWKEMYIYTAVQMIYVSPNADQGGVLKQENPNVAYCCMCVPDDMNVMHLVDEGTEEYMLGDQHRSNSVGQMYGRDI